MKKIFSLLFTLIIMFSLTASTSFAAVNKQINANIKTKKIPAGTIITLRVLDPVNSATASVGDQFDLMVVDNVYVKNSVAIPQGSVVRGSLEEVHPSKMLYKGGLIRLYFDHIVSSTGKQVPFTAGICNNTAVTYDGALSSKTNYKTALSKTVQKTKNIVVKPTTWAWEKGEDLYNGSPKYVMAPLTAFVCVPVAGFYFVGDSIVNVFRKGEEYSISQGDTIQVQLIKPLDMPVL